MSNSADATMVQLGDNSVVQVVAGTSSFSYGVISIPWMLPTILANSSRF